MILRCKVFKIKSAENKIFKNKRAGCKVKIVEYVRGENLALIPQSNIVEIKSRT